MSVLRTVQAMRTVISELDLNLNGLTVYTEAATGPYAITAVLAAMAGARKAYALARDNRYGSRVQAIAETRSLACIANVDQVIEFVTEKQAEHLAETDILTNAGNVRPIDEQTIASLVKETAVIPLMYEGWELRSTDLDVPACCARGILIGGTNERHPRIRFFDYLGMMALKLMLDAQFEVLDTRIALICDNAFAPYIVSTLLACGAEVRAFGAVEYLECLKDRLALLKSLTAIDKDDIANCHAVLVAASLHGERAVIGKESKALIRASMLGQAAPGVEVFEFCWGGAVDREALADLKIKVWPEVPPPKGHMGVVPSVLGSVPLVRLQAGGLKVGEVLSRLRRAGISVEQAMVELERTGYGTSISC
jgi:hypothetical protein